MESDGYPFPIHLYHYTPYATYRHMYMMNWTGGRLSRHLSAKSSTNSKQKQHYARVQPSSHGESKTRSPIKWSIIDQATEDERHPQRRVKTFARSKQPSSRDSSCSVPPCLQSTVKQIPLTSTNATRRSFQAVGPQSSQTSRTQFEMDQKLSPDGRYDATPTLRETDRKHTTPFSKSEGLQGRKRNITISERKQNLLRKTNWIHIDIQEPAPLDFVLPQRDENIGRRRTINGRHKSRFDARQGHIDSLFDGRYRVNNETSPGWYASGMQKNRADIRLSIGSKIAQTEMSSGMSHGRISRHSSHAHSSVMLLDDSIESPVIYKRRKLNPATRQFSTLGASSGSASRNLNLPLPDKQCNGSSSKDRGQASGRNEIFFGQTKRYGFGITSSPFLKSSFPKPTSSAISTTKTLVHEDRFLYSLSPVSIQQPAPQSSKVSSLLRSDSSNMGGSTLAQLQRAEPTESASQAVDHETWQSWMPIFDQHADGMTEDGWVGEHHSTSISPDVSTAPIIWEAGGKLATTEQFSRTVDLALSRLKGTGREPLELKTPTLQQKGPGESIIIRDREGRRIRILTEALTKTIPATKLHIRTSTCVKNGAEFKLAPAHPKADSDDLWRRFVFGSDEED